jgi:hypothetical protein
VTRASLGFSWGKPRSQLVCSRMPTSSATLAPWAQPEPAITLPAAIWLPRRKQTHGPFPPLPSRPTNGSDPLAVRTMNLQPAATTVRCRHICQSASRCVCVQAQLINVTSFEESHYANIVPAARRPHDPHSLRPAGQDPARGVIRFVELGRNRNSRTLKDRLFPVRILISSTRHRGRRSCWNKTRLTTRGASGARCTTAGK